MAGNGWYMKSSPTINFEQRTELSWAIFYIPCYASFIIYFTIIHKIFVYLFAYYNYLYYICRVIQK